MESHAARRGAARRGAAPLALGLALLGPAPPAASEPAETEADATREIPVYDVYVTSERDVVSAVTTTRRITREDMRQESARTLDEALVREPSVVVRTGGEGSPRVDIRGLRTRQVLTLIDGVPFYSTDDGAFDPSLIPTQVVERIDVTYSNSSVLYGDGPIAGIVQIRTRSGEPGVHPEAKGDLREGPQALGELSVAGGSGAVEGFAAGRFFSADGYPLPEGFDPRPLEDGDLRENSDREQANFFGKLGVPSGERGRVDLLFDYRHAEYGVPWRVEQQTDFVGRARFERVERLEGFTSQLSGQVDVSDRVGLRSWGFVTRQVEERAIYDGPGLDFQLDRDSGDLKGTALIGGGALHGRVDGGALGVLRLAANGRYEQFESQGHLRESNLGPFDAIDARDGLGAWSLGAEYELRPVEPLGLVVGYAHAFLDGEQGVRDDGSLFLAGASLDLPTGTRLRASAAHKLRFPSLRQLYDVDGGNVDLDSERCWCFEAGVTQELGSWLALDVTGFWLDLSDFIERDDDTRIFENRQELESRGIEVAAVATPWEPLLLRAAYTLLDTRDRSAGSPFDRLDNRPRHKVDAEVRGTLPWRMVARVAVTWLGDNLIYSRSDPVRRELTEDFAIFDVRLEQPFLDERLRVYAGVDNLFDEESEINVAFPQPGRVVYGGVDLRF